MAIAPHARKPLRTLLVLVILLAAMAGGMIATTKFGDGRLTPKLGLDLEGGTEMVLAPVLTDPNAPIAAGVIEQARNIIEQRVNVNGVSEAEVTVLGGRDIDVAIPGTPDQATLDAISKPSQLRFRAVLAETAGSTAAAGSGTATATGTATTGPTTTAPTTSGPMFTPNAPATANTAPATSAPDIVPQAFRAETTPPAPTGGATTGGATTGGATTGGATPTATPTNGSDPAWITPAIEQQFTALDCSKPGAVNDIVDDPAKPLVTCSADTSTKYILGPVEVDGTDISNADYGYQPGPTGQPTSIVQVTLSFTGDGAKKFAAVTSRLVGLHAQAPRDQFAVVLDKQVITSPTSQAAITNGQASITGNFTMDSARTLAQQLKFGALPMSFQLQTQDDISPTLGSEQLRLGLIAGLIGLLLVVVYSLFQYRALGLVTVASLVIAATLTYLTLTLLGWAYNFRLTMAGVTGVIVSIGVTADSFIVYFERIRDEVRDGRPLVAAVEAGWARARRTIIAADAVNFLAAGVLYLLASSSVRGFAFALGVTTIIDVVIVFVFTHPVVQLLARTKFFGGGHKWSGLDPERLGAKVRYAGRGRIRPPEPTPGPAGSTTEGLA